MKRFFTCCLVFIGLVLSNSLVKAQCNNADFETGDFTGWTGTWDLYGGAQPGCSSYPLPFLNPGLNQDLSPNGGPTNEFYNHFIMNGGNDRNLYPRGILPNVWPGSGAFSAIVGSTKAEGRAESLSYTFTVTPNNTNFTYHYAAVLFEGVTGHPPNQQPYFRIQMVAGTTDTITCANYRVNGSTAPSIGGFAASIKDTFGNSPVFYKPWTSVLIPLNNYLGQTVTITFIAASCSPNNCSGSHYAYAHVDAECSPLQLLSQTPSVCPGGSDILTAPTGAASYQWYTVPAGGQGIVGTDTNQTVTINQPGRYGCTLTTFGQPPCSFSLDTLITGSPEGPVANFSSPNICAGVPAQLSDLSTPTGSIVSWNWTFTGATTASSTAQNPTVTFPSQGTYPVTLDISAGSCAADTTINIYVHSIPSATFTASTPVCAGINSDIAYTGGAPATASYNWTFNGGNVASGSGQGPFQVNWTNSGNQPITLTVVDSGCTSPLVTNHVVVNPIPVLNITPHSTICFGATKILTVSGASAYAWAANNSLSDTNTASVIASPTFSRSYTVTGTSQGCSSTDTTSITVYPIPTSTFTAATPVCTGQQSKITYTGNAASNATYNWNFAGDNAADPGTGQGPQEVTWGTPGVKKIILNVSEFGCIAPPDTQPVTVYAIPTADFNATSPVCAGFASVVTYAGTANNTGTYVWNFDGGTAKPGGTTMGPDSVIWTHAGIENIILVVTENGCVSPPDTVLVTVNPVPTAFFNATTPLCVTQNGNINYIGSATSTAVFTWNLDGANVVSGSLSGPGPFVVNWSDTGTMTLTLNVSDQGCIAQPDTEIVVIDSTPVSIAGAPVAFCSGGSATIGGPIKQGYNYIWTPATGLSSNNSSEPTVSLTNITSSIFTQTYLVGTSSQGCKSWDSVTVTVNPLPVAQFTPPAPQCLLNNSFNFVAQGTHLPIATFAWNFGASSTPPTSMSANQTVQYGIPQTTAVTLTVSQVNCADSITDSVTIWPEPSANFVPDTVMGCENFEVCFLNHSLAVPQALYSWNFGDGGLSGDINPCHLYVAPGVYSVSLKVVSGQGCEHDTTQDSLITVIANPIADFTPSYTSVEQPQSQIQFINQSQNASNYLWYFFNAGVKTNVLDSTTVINPYYSFENYGAYNILLYAYNLMGCVDSINKPITVTPPQNFYIPNAFTPNGDGNNDEFYPLMQEGATLISFQVFDRIGEKVHDGLFPWDGTFKGQKAMEGVYVYHVKFKMTADGVQFHRKGSVTLIR